MRMHTDPSWITINIALNPPSEYEGGGILFPTLGSQSLRQEEGQGVIHPGYAPHMSTALTKGFRYGFQVWISYNPGETQTHLKAREESTMTLYCAALKRQWEPVMRAELYFRLARMVPFAAGAVQECAGIELIASRKVYKFERFFHSKELNHFNRTLP